MTRPLCPVCGFEIGDGFVVRMQWGDRTGQVIACPNCVAFRGSQHVLEGVAGRG